MSTLTLPWLPAMYLAMLLGVATRNIRPSSMRSFLSTLPVPTSTTARTGFSEPLDQVEVRAFYKHRLTKEESAAFSRLPINKNILTKKTPELAASIMQGIQRNLDKHSIGGQVNITNNMSHFSAEENSRSKMKKEVKDLKQTNQSLKQMNKSLKQMNKVLRANDRTSMDFTDSSLGIQACLCEGQMDMAREKIQVHLRSRASLEYNPKHDSTTRVAIVRAERNRIAHALELRPCLLVVKMNPAQELTFNALFGTSSSEAIALSRFDRFRSLQVDKVMNMHAELWSRGIGNEFVNPYDKWLGAVRSLRSNQTRDLALTSSAKRFADEAYRAGFADYGTADKIGRDPFMKIRKRYWGLGLNSPSDPYYWKGVVLDWKKRNLWQKLVVQWDLPKFK